MFILMDNTNTCLAKTCIKVIWPFRCKTINGPDLIHIGVELHVIMFMYATHTDFLSLPLYTPKVWNFHSWNGGEEQATTLIQALSSTCKVKTRSGFHQRARSTALNGLIGRIPMFLILQVVLLMIMAKENTNSYSAPCSRS